MKSKTAKKIFMMTKKKMKMVDHISLSSKSQV